MVTVFPAASSIVAVNVLFAPEVRLAVEPDNTTCDAAPGETVTLSGDPVPVVVPTVPSVTLMLIGPSALYNVMTPLLEPDTVATPLVNVIAVALPKLIALPDELLTVGLNAPIELAPLNVRLLLPV